MQTLTFLEFWRSLSASEKQALHIKSGTPYMYLSQLAHGHRKAGATVCARLKNADSRITDEMLRPDLYGEAA